jgi:hypothetical protein
MLITLDEYLPQFKMMGPLRDSLTVQLDVIRSTDDKNGLTLHADNKYGN